MKGSLLKGAVLDLMCLIWEQGAQRREPQGLDAAGLGCPGSGGICIAADAC